MSKVISKLLTNTAIRQIDMCHPADFTQVELHIIRNRDVSWSIHLGKASEDLLSEQVVFSSDPLKIEELETNIHAAVLRVVSRIPADLNVDH